MRERSRRQSADRIQDGGGGDDGRAAWRSIYGAARGGNDRQDAQPFLQRFIEEFFIQIFTEERKAPFRRAAGCGKGD